MELCEADALPHGRSPSAAVRVCADQGSQYLDKRRGAQKNPEVDSLPHGRSPSVAGVASSEGILQHQGSQEVQKET